MSPFRANLTTSIGLLVLKPAVNDISKTLGSRLLRGRLISSSDVASARRIAVVNHTLAEQYFPHQSPIGQQIKFNVLDQIPGTPHDAYCEIVGIVSDFRNVGLQQSVQPEAAFVPYTFSGFGDRNILVRTAANPNLFVNTFRQVLADVDPNPILSHPIRWKDCCTRMSM